MVAFLVPCPVSLNLIFEHWKGHLGNGSFPLLPFFPSFLLCFRWCTFSGMIWRFGRDVSHFFTMTTEEKFKCILQRPLVQPPGGFMGLGRKSMRIYRVRVQSAPKSPGRQIWISGVFWFGLNLFLSFVHSDWGFAWAILSFSQRTFSKLNFTTALLFYLVLFTLTLWSYFWEECVIGFFKQFVSSSFTQTWCLGYCVPGGVLIAWDAEPHRIQCFHGNQKGLSSTTFQDFLVSLHWKELQTNVPFLWPISIFQPAT